MSLSLQLGLVYLISELLLTVTRRSLFFVAPGRAVLLLVGFFGWFWVFCGARSCAGGPSSRSVAFFTVDVTIEKDHELVERGPFRLVRHPSYTGVLLAFVGFALSLRNWAALLIILVPIFMAFIRRMNVEEEALTRGARLALRRLHEADQTAGAVCLLKRRPAV